MANKHDSFRLNGNKSKEKKEKPIKQKKEKKASLGIGSSSSFHLNGHENKPEKKQKGVVKEKKAKSFRNGEAKVSLTGSLKNGEKAVNLKGSGNTVKSDPKVIAIIGGACAALIIVAVVIFAVVIPSVEAHNMEIVGIEITKLPDKLVYWVGDETPDYTGLNVTVTRRNGETFIVRAYECEIQGFRTDATAKQRIITVKYGGFSDIFSIAVNEKTKPAPILTGIRLEPMPKTEYKVGERLNVDGAYVVREYMDGSTVKVNLLKTDIDGWSEAYYGGPGTYTLTVSYYENGVTVYAYFDVTITSNETDNN